ncbi:hypothetical protein MBLNU230_g7808t1 [Neophaeotheca triangularis]
MIPHLLSYTCFAYRKADDVEQTSPAFHSLVGAHSFLLGQAAWHYRPTALRRHLSSTTSRTQEKNDTFNTSYPTSSQSSESTAADSSHQTLPPDWDDDPDYNITAFSQLPHRFFGYNQHIKVNEEFKESLRQILWQFRAPIRYAFAYGSGVFSQKLSDSADGSSVLSPHPHPPKAVEDWQKGGHKIIDFIFGVSHTQHWHSLNLTQHPEHYSGLKYLPYSSAAISKIQDNFGAGVYFNPYINANGTMIKYGVVNLDTLCRDLSEWDTLYLAGRLQKPVKILRDDPKVRLANQVNLISAVRTALLSLPEKFTERQLYERIAGLSYLGDPRMNSYLGGENPRKVANIVGAQLPAFRQLYVPLIENLPNVDFTDSRKPQEEAWEKEDAIRHTGATPNLQDVLGGETGLNLTQDLDPKKRGNMVRRLPKAFRQKLYHQYQEKFQIPGSAFDAILDQSRDDDDGTETFRRREGGEFERRIAAQEDLPEQVSKTVRNTVSWSSTSQSVKSVFTAGLARSWRYYSDKRAKSREKPAKPAAAAPETSEGKGEKGE